MAWLTGWLYRKAITVSNGSADYQTKVLVGESSGATGEEVDCGGKCQTDFDDLRFTGSDGQTLLDYWIESITGTTPNQLATIWVQNDATPSTTCYMYYGKADATAVSDGDATFPFYDHFPNSSVDTNKWTVAGTPVVASSRVLVEVAESIKGKVDISNSGFFAIRWSGHVSAEAAGTMSEGCGQAYDLNACSLLSQASPAFYRLLNDAWSAANTVATDASDYIYEITHPGTGTATIYRNGVSMATVATNDTNAKYIVIRAGVTGSSGHLDTDWIFARKFAATEPTFAFGSEEYWIPPFRNYYPHILAH